MTDHPSAAAGTSQCDIILAALQNKAGQWVSLPEWAFSSGSMAVHSRISDLRERGHIIEHRNQRKGRKVHSSYRLLSESQP
jgi:biotin operon repressor